MTHSSRNILITGCSGFLGQFLIDKFNKIPEFKIIRAGRRPADDIAFDIKHPEKLEINSRIDFVIHCGFDFEETISPCLNNINYTASRLLYDKAKHMGAQLFIFISSMSAHDQCRSSYALSKFKTEAELSQHNDIVIIRPGLLYDDQLASGTFAKMLSMVEKSAFLPLIDGGKQPQYITHLEDLFTLLFDMVIKTKSITYQKPIFVGDSTDRSLKLLLEYAAAKPLKTIYIPWWSAWIAIKFSELLGIHLSFRSDSIIGLKDAKKLSQLDISVDTLHNYWSSQFLHKRKGLNESI